MSTNGSRRHNIVESPGASTDGVTRRRFLQGVGVSVGALAAPAFLKSGRASAAEKNSTLFSLGVASGDPSFHSVVLWTRLAPEPLQGGGMPNRPVLVRWEVATDRGMRHVIRRGVAVALAETGHAVHAFVVGLPSNHWFYYRFFALGEASRVGRTRTFPASRDGADRMRFAVASCQDFQDGFYAAYRDMAEQELDFVVHVGDYIYENGPTDAPIAAGRQHSSPEIFTVEEYRNRYALYRLDPHLQAAHARFPFILTPDDHEVDNNYAGLIPEASSPSQGEEFAIRRRNAYQVYTEAMPLRVLNLGSGAPLRFFRRLRFGDLADIHVLDTRQFRTDQPAADGFGSTDPASLLVEPVFGEQLFDAAGIQNPNSTMLGAQQEQWLAHNLSRAQATWNILAQQVMLTRWNLVEAGRKTIELDPRIPPAVKASILQALANVDDVRSVDAWDGYPAARRRLFDLLAAAKVSNPVVLSGDIHAAWGADLLDDFGNPLSQIVAAEFVCTSISSSFGGRDPRPTDTVVRASVVADNPHVEFYNGLFRGYCLCDVNRARWQTTYRAVGSLAALGSSDPQALIPFADTPVETDAILEIAAGFNAPGSDRRLTTRFARVPLHRCLGTSAASRGRAQPSCLECGFSCSLTGRSGPSDAGARANRYLVVAAPRMCSCTRFASSGLWRTWLEISLY